MHKKCPNGGYFSYLFTHIETEIIGDKRNVRCSIKEYSQNCILQLLTREILIFKKIYLVRGIISFLLYHDIFNLVKRDNFHGIEKLRQSAYRISLKIFCIKNLLSRNFKNCSSKSTTFFAVCHMYGLLLL